MSRESETAPGVELTTRLGYLIKRAHQRLIELTALALEPFGLTGRELAVLLVLDALGPTSQLAAAKRIGTDRTTMVGLIDGLELKGLVVRERLAEDRRKNVVRLTVAGHGTFVAARDASDAAEAAFLQDLSESEAAQFRSQLLTVLGFDTGD